MNSNIQAVTTENITPRGHMTAACDLVFKVLSWQILNFLNWKSKQFHDLIAVNLTSFPFLYCFFSVFFLIFYWTIFLFTKVIYYSSFCNWNIGLILIAELLVYESYFFSIPWKLKVETGIEASTESLIILRLWSFEAKKIMVLWFRVRL